MAQELTLKYDETGDILYMDRVPPRSDQRSNEAGEGIIVRSNAATGEIENLEVMFFSRHSPVAVAELLMALLAGKENLEQRLGSLRKAQ